MFNGDRHLLVNFFQLLVDFFLILGKFCLQLLLMLGDLHANALNVANHVILFVCLTDDGIKFQTSKIND